MKKALAGASYESPRMEAELLLGEVLDKSPENLILSTLDLVTQQEWDRAQSLLARRLAGEPLAYILGKKGFYKFEFKVNSNVLIPRPETEHVVEVALQTFTDRSQTLKIVDFGAGSGCISLSLLKEYERAHAILIDVSSSALEVAQENAIRLGVADRVSFVEQNLMKSLDELKEDWFRRGLPVGKMDLVVSNPPYISYDSHEVAEDVKVFEPHLALFSDAEGFAHLKHWFTLAEHMLKSGGRFIFEFGRGQEVEIERYLQNNFSAKFGSLKKTKDLANIWRVVSAQKF